MTRKGKSWTEDQVTAIRVRLGRGESMRSVAASIGCTVANISRRLKAADDPIGKRVYTMRCEAMSFDDVAREFNMEPGPPTTRRLYMRLVRYCERAGVAYPHVERAPAPPAPRTYDEDLMFRLVFLLRRRAARLEDSDNEVVADTLQVSETILKFHVAELRRRNIIANGIVPTREGHELAASEGLDSTVRTEVLRTVVKTWASNEPCETLRSLSEKLPFSRSSINLAIVRLRDDGFLAPRGNLYLRDLRYE